MHTKTRSSSWCNIVYFRIFHPISFQTELCLRFARALHWLIDFDFPNGSRCLKIEISTTKPNSQTVWQEWHELCIWFVNRLFDTISQKKEHKSLVLKGNLSVFMNKNLNFLQIAKIVETEFILNCNFNRIDWVTFCWSASEYGKGEMVVEN